MSFIRDDNAIIGRAIEMSGDITTVHSFNCNRHLPERPAGNPLTAFLKSTLASQRELASRNWAAGLSKTSKTAAET